MIPSYSKVYALGHKAVRNIFSSEVSVQEKLDGSQYSCSLHDGVLEHRSHHQVIYPNAIPKLFSKVVETMESLNKKGLLRENWIYRGEAFYKPKHNVLAYDRVPKGNIILFDIDTSFGMQNYLSYQELAEEANRLGLEVVPQFFTGTVESKEELQKLLETTSILGGQKVEGIVIKNYNLFSAEGKTLMAKYVSEKFKEVNKSINKTKSNRDFIELIISKFRTQARWDKAIIHLRESGKLIDDPRDIGILLKEIDKDFTEECGDEVKEMLFGFFKRRIIKGVALGFPEYYKKRLMEKQFDKQE